MAISNDERTSQTSDKEERKSTIICPSTKREMGSCRKTHMLLAYSAYEVKNNCRSFERLFKVKKNGVFLFGISFFVMEIFKFLYYANEGSDDVIGGSIKTVQHSLMNISRNIKAAFFKLGTRDQHHERRKRTPVVLLP